MTSNDLCLMAATELLEAYAGRTVSPVEVMTAVFARSEALNPKINALFHLVRESAMEQARASEARWGAGRPMGVLDGLPVTIKDSIATAGMPYWRGCKGNMNKPLSAYDSPPAARLKEAGAIIFAKTTMPDMGMFGAGVSTAHGITRNPWNLAFNTSGSTSGGAAAVAAGLGPLTVGSDIAGSVRLPASMCGLASIKPTQGRIPHLPPSPIRSAGPLARTVRDAALLLSVLSAPDARDYGGLALENVAYADHLDGDVAGLRLGLMLNPGFGYPLEPAVLTAIERAAARLAKAGAIVELIAPLTSPDIGPALNTVFAVRSRIELDGMPAEARAQVNPAILELCSSVDHVSGLQLSRLYDLIEQVKTNVVKATSKVDYMIAPTAPVVNFPAEAIAPDPDDTIGFAAYTALFNQTGQPAAVVCCGFDERKLPIGLQIIGQRFNDLGVLKVARAYEALRGFTMDWPYPA